MTFEESWSTDRNPTATVVISTGVEAVTPASQSQVTPRHRHGSERGTTTTYRVSEPGPPTRRDLRRIPPACVKCRQPKPPEAFPLIEGSGFPGPRPTGAVADQPGAVRRWCVECLVDAKYLRRVFLDRWYAFLDQRERVAAELARTDAYTVTLLDQAKDPAFRRALLRAARILDA